MAGPRSIRFDASTDAQLAAFVQRHPGMSHSGAAALLVDEGLRMDAHPGIVFREGPAGRRAVLVGGPDVWEVVRALASARAHEPTLTGDQLLHVIAENSGVTRQLLDVAVAYYSEYPDEINALISECDGAEQAAVAAVARRRELLGA